MIFFYCTIASGLLLFACTLFFLYKLSIYIYRKYIKNPYIELFDLLCLAKNDFELQIDMLGKKLYPVLEGCDKRYLTFFSDYECEGQAKDSPCRMSFPIKKAGTYSAEYFTGTSRILEVKKIKNRFTIFHVQYPKKISEYTAQPPSEIIPDKENFQGLALWFRKDSGPLPTSLSLLGQANYSQMFDDPKKNITVSKMTPNSISLVCRGMQEEWLMPDQRVILFLIFRKFKNRVVNLLVEGSVKNLEKAYTSSWTLAIDNWSVLEKTDKMFEWEVAEPFLYVKPITEMIGAN